MRHIFLAVIAVIAAYTAGCQNLSVSGFSLLESDMTARTIAPERDANGELTALIRVVSTASGFVFEGGSLGIVKADQRVGEWWVYVPDGARTLTIRHPQLGVMRNYAYPVPVRGGSVYELVLVHGNVEVVVRERQILTEFVVINTEPPGADVYLNNEPVGKTPFATDKPEGRYEWRVERNLYLPQAGIFDLVPGEQVRLDLELVPDFGSVSVSSNPEQGATIMLNGLDVGKTTPTTLERLPTGEHTLVLSHQWYGTVTKKITIKAGEQTNEVISMSPTFGDVTVAAASDEEVFVNGSSKGKGTWKGRLAPGVYQVEVRKASHKPAKRQIAIKSGDVEVLELSPEPIYSSLRIVSDPLDAEIFLNGVSYGMAPKIIRDLLVGDYNLELRKPSFGVYRTNVSVVEGQMNEVNGVLTSMGVITVSSQTSAVEVYFNGSYKGLAPLTIGDLEPGDYRVELRKNGHDTYSKTVRISAGSNETVEATLKEASAAVTVNSSPSGAIVYVNGNQRGITPQRIEGLSAGTYDLELQRDGYVSLKRRLYVKSGDNSTVSYDLSPTKKTRQANQSGAEFLMYTYEANNPIGLSIGEIDPRAAGYYINFKMNTDIFTSALWTIDDAGNTDAPGLVERTGEVRNGSICLSTGITFKVVYPIWSYVGGGLGYFPVYEYADRYYSTGSFWMEDWFRNTDQTRIAFFREAGFMLKLGDAMVLKYGWVLHDGINTQLGIAVQF